jgi:DNA-binding transcriptional LysR family regulator
MAALVFTSGAVARAEVAGRVRLATAETLATNLILPSLKTLQKRYPNLIIEVITDIATANLHRRDADLALRMVKPERGNVTVRRVGTLGWGVYCHPDYRDGRGQPPSRDHYEHCGLIQWGELYANLRAAQWVDKILGNRPPAVVTTSQTTQLAAASAGLGLAVLPHFLARAAGLVCVEKNLGIDHPIYLVIQSDLTHSPRTRAVADFLSELVLAKKRELSGPDQ